MLLSKNFPLSEFEFSQTAALHDIDNALPVLLLPAAMALATNVLQPMRDAIGLPLAISSGFRCQALERVLKGLPAGWESTSQHTKGEAADIRPPAGMTNVDLANVVLTLARVSGLQFDQMIVELPGQARGWLHVSYREGANRMDVRSWLGGSEYPKGIVRA